MRRAVGIVRVSRVAGREGESFASPREQLERIASACERDGLQLVETIEELDVSGGAPLERREGLRQAVEMVEAGAAQVVVVAYFDRLVRSLSVQAEVVRRVENAGGAILAVDAGAISEATASQWLSGTFLGTVAEYHRRVTRERAGAAQARAVARGVAPWPSIPPGYTRSPSGVLQLAENAPAVAEAFAMRAEGATIKEVREFLRMNGIARSYHGVQAMLRSRVYLGELHFGDLANAEAHEPLVGREVWQAAQRPARGPRARSKRLLARLGVLRCGTCGSRMVVGTAQDRGRTYPFYRCPPTGDCPRRVTISAAMVEKAVAAAIRGKFGDARGRASGAHRALEAAARADQAQANLDAAIRAFAEVSDEPAALGRLRELRQARDEAADEARQLSSLRSRVMLRLADDWDRLSLEAQRAVILAAVEKVTIGVGRGPSRISITLRD